MTGAASQKIAENPSERRDKFPRVCRADVQNKLEEKDKNKTERERESVYVCVRGQKEGKEKIKKTQGRSLKVREVVVRARW